MYGITRHLIDILLPKNVSNYLHSELFSHLETGFDKYAVS